MGGLRSSAIRDLLALSREPGVLSLAGGLPAPSTFPAARVADATRQVLARDAVEPLQYGPTEGDPRLREWIARYESARAGDTVDPSRVIVTAGSQQALDLLARTLCAPGDTVVVEEPAYLGGLQAWSAAGAVLEPVPSDGDGLDVDELARRLARGLRPAAAYVVPTFQNPTGAVLSPARRHRLAALADRYGFTVVEDDPYAEIRFADDPVRPVRAANPDVVTLGTFSKTVAPGLRVGWAVLPPDLVGPVTRLKQAADLQSGSLGQALVAELVCDEAWWAQHLVEVRATYARHARALADALAGAFGDRLAVSRPRGGMFLWGRFTDGTPTRPLLRAALARGVAFVPGEEFGVAAPDRSALRLSYATHPPVELAEAAARLAAAHRESAGQLAGSRSASS